MQGQLQTTTEQKAFILAGNATVTFQSVAKGNHFTFKVRACEDKEGLFFVSLLTGSDNENNFRYIGTIANIGDDEAVFRHGKKSKIEESAPGVQAFMWTWKRIRAGVEQKDVEVFHEGKCGRCGRKLTVPSSIANGLGPDCAEIMGFVCEAA